VQRGEIDVRNAQTLERAVAPDEVGDEVVRGFGEQAIGRVVLREVTAYLQDRDVIAHLDGLVDVVRHEHDGLAQRLLQAKEFVLQLGAGDGIDGAERLVHQHDRRIGRECARHADALALPTGELGRVPLRVLARREADQREQFVDARGDARSAPAEKPRHRRNVRGDGLMREQAHLLDHVPDPAPELDGIDAQDVFVVDEDLARGRLDEPVDHAQDRRLAASRRSDEDADLAGGNLEAQVVDRDQSAGILLPHGLEPDH
jgi:hypothetical protein